MVPSEDSPLPLWGVWVQPSAKDPRSWQAMWPVQKQNKQNRLTKIKTNSKNKTKQRKKKRKQQTKPKPNQNKQQQNRKKKNSIKLKRYSLKKIKIE